MTALVRELHSVVFPARDLVTAVEFWSRVLQRPPTFRTDDYAGFELGELSIGLSRLPWVDEPLVFLAVEDVRSAHRLLCEAGARTMVEAADGSLAEQGTEPAVAGVDPETGAVDVPGARLAVLRGPGGTLIGLNEDMPT